MRSIRPIACWVLLSAPQAQLRAATKPFTDAAQDRLAAGVQSVGTTVTHTDIT